MHVSMTLPKNYNISGCENTVYLTGIDKVYQTRVNTVIYYLTSKFERECIN